MHARCLYVQGNTPSHTSRRRNEEPTAVSSESGSHATSPTQTIPGSPLLYSAHTQMEPPPKPEDISDVAGFATQPKLVPTMIVCKLARRWMHWLTQP